MYLVIAEKPSVSRAIARVIGAENREEGFLSGKDCIVSWCLGHLAEYLPPDGYDKKYESWKYEDLPIIPDEWKLAVSREKKEQFYTLKRLLNSPDVEYVVNACDAGREGELIFRRVYQLSGSRKTVKRLWVSSMEDSAIRAGMEQLKDAEEYRNLAIIITQGVPIWNDFFLSMLFLSSSTKKTLPLVMLSFMGDMQKPTQWTMLFAACFLSALPMLIIYAFLQKQFVGGLTAGAVKG